eukprot:GHVS01100824.1.p1 GENE.GHVS01100824.1~~GHVS01100824.1.p1  ORF type:complete len:610 (+),score=46.57 GHVS01100824.1:870-2699(+)
MLEGFSENAELRAMDEENWMLSRRLTQSGEMESSTSYEQKVVPSIRPLFGSLEDAKKGQGGRQEARKLCPIGSASASASTSEESQTAEELKPNSLKRAKLNSSQENLSVPVTTQENLSVALEYVLECLAADGLEPPPEESLCNDIPNVGDNVSTECQNAWKSVETEMKTIKANEELAQSRRDGRKRCVSSSGECQVDKGFCPTGSKGARMNESVEARSEVGAAADLGQLAAPVQKGAETKVSVALLLDNAYTEGLSDLITIHLERGDPTNGNVFYGSLKKDESVKDDQVVELQFEFVAKPTWQVPERWGGKVGYVYPVSTKTKPTIYQLYLPIADGEFKKVELKSASSKLVYKPSAASNNVFNGFNVRFLLEFGGSRRSYHVELVCYASGKGTRLKPFVEINAPSNHGKLVKVTVELPDLPSFQKLSHRSFRNRMMPKKCKIQWQYEGVTEPVITYQPMNMYFIVRVKYPGTNNSNVISNISVAANKSQCDLSLSMTDEHFGQWLTNDGLSSAIYVEYDCQGSTTRAVLLLYSKTIVRSIRELRRVKSKKRISLRWMVTPYEAVNKGQVIRRKYEADLDLSRSSFRPELLYSYGTNVRSKLKFHCYLLG